MNGGVTMLCERCKENQATVHYTEVINGKKRQLNLCENCAGELQPQSFSFMPQLSFHDFLGGLMGHGIETGSGFAKTTRDVVRCQACGLTETQFSQRGLLGCGHCYESFSGTVDSLVKRIHGSRNHSGKVPEKTSDRVKLAKKLESLRTQLKQAVESEEFERAAQLRDSIKELEKRLDQEG